MGTRRAIRGMTVTEPIIARQWADLPGGLAGRWLPLRVLVGQCFKRGLTVEIQSGTQEVRLPTPAEQFVFGGGPATYVQYRKALYLTEDVAYGLDVRYGDYAGDIHEFGHAVWYLLLTPWERWVRYLMLWRTEPALDGYAATKVEEGWAQDFEAFWTDCPLPEDAPHVHAEPSIDHCRVEFCGRAPRRFALVAGIMRRLGA